ncbi:probable ATP-dependent RNA helicase spindle-E isoform X2 [Epargyreus clarus]
MKILVADESTNFTSLQMSWASKTNCEQRAGRAGRVRDGRVYRLVTDKFYDNFQQECPPEIVRCPLERLVLLAKMLEMGPPSDVLALAMDPPDMSNIHRTVLVLKELGGLKKTIEEEWCPFDGELTRLGRVMAMLPLDVRVSKLIMLGYIFGILEESVIMAAAMSVKNVFSSPFRERLNAYNSKLTWADGSTSDCIAFLNVYKVWNHLRQQQFFKQSGNSEAQWARRFFVQVRALRELDALVRELRTRLSREGVDSTGHSPWAKHELPLIFKIILAGAFYPQYFVQVSTDEERERDAVKLLGGLNPRNTVYLKNFPDGQPTEVYTSAIKNIVKQQIGDEPRVTFDRNSQKVYLSFVDDEFALRGDKRSGDPTIPGQVVLPVYKAVKARQLKMDIRIPLLPIEKARQLAKALEESKASFNVNKMVPRLPDIDDTHFPLKICQLLNVGNFYAHYDDESTRSELAHIHSALNRKPLLAYTGPVAPELIVAAPYADGTSTQYYRARVTKVLPRDIVEVSYIDYGSVGRVGVSNLRALPSGLSAPPLAVRCALSGVAPAPLLHAHAHWAPAATKYFADVVGKPHLLAKVYSVTHGVVAVELLADNGRININKELIAKGFAVPSEESYESKLNHDLRQTATELNMAQKRAYNKEQSELAFCPAQDAGPLNYKECVSDAYLKGPFSPLETTIHNLMYASRDKQVCVEGSSVNSVLLDTAPQEIYQRLLVAADIGQNELNSKVTLRHTTLMPNIPCLPALISLLFCPVAELRRHPDGSRYVSVLCGLGADELGAPHFPEHDLLVDIDAELSVDDIGLVNHIRHLMDYMMDVSEEAVADNSTRNDIPKFIRKDLMALLLKRRKHREPETVLNAWEWRSVPEEEMLEITEPAMVARAELFPLHAPLELRAPARDRLLALKRANDELKLLVGRSSISSTAQYSCKLCSTPPMPANTMRIHLYSNAHKDKEEDFRIFQS